MRAVLLPLLLLPVLAAAQMLRVVPSEREAEHPSWDPAFIQRNGITAITGVPSVKPDGRPMRELPERLLHRFDGEGRLVYSNSTHGRPGTGLDTTSVAWTYDAAGRAVAQLRTDLAGHYLLETTLDSLGRPVNETYVRVANTGPDRYRFQPGERTVISDERYAYRTESDTAWVREYRNNLGLPYREQRHASDQWGYLRSIEDRYLVSGRRSRVSFRYDEKGRLAERIVRPDLREARSTTETFRYDAAGNLTTLEVYHDDRHVRHEEFLYEEHTMFLKARLTKDMTTGQIHVVRYHTERR